MQKLTATQKIEICNAYDKKTLNDNNYGSNSHKDHELVSPDNFSKLLNSLGIDYDAGVKIANETRSVYWQTKLESIVVEGYEDTYTKNPEVVNYIKNMARQEASQK